jgi:hypothetical protein
MPKVKDISRKDYFEHAGASGGFIDFLGYPFCRGRIFDEVEYDKGQYDDEKGDFLGYRSMHDGTGNRLA